MLDLAFTASAGHAPFKLELQGIPAEAYSVQAWRYEARLDEPYTLTLVLHLLREQAALFGPDLQQRLNRPSGLPATFALQAQAHSFEPVHGAVAHIALGQDLLQEAAQVSNTPWSAGPDVIACSLIIRPRLWWASLGQHSRSFQRLSVADTVRQVLAQSLGLGAADLAFRLSGPPLRRRYRQQFQESDLAYVSRLLEREGYAYFFEQGEDREVMVITDDAAGWQRPPQWRGVRCVAESGLKAPIEFGIDAGWSQVISRFSRKFSAVPTEFVGDDYNYRSAATSLQAQTSVQTGPRLGLIQFYGVHSKTPDEAQLRLAHTRERFAQHALRASAASSLSALAPGQCIGILAGPTPMEQRAQGRWLILSVRAQGDRQQPYSNQFTAQPEATPYRPEWDTPLPEMAGFTHMRLDTTEAANPYPRLDGHGRYLAWHYFEHQQSPNGLGSAPIRLARDYAGPTYGQHFPVHAGVEALAGYVQGDPDRPVLLGVVHDSRNPNHVTAANASRHVLRTWANNKFRLEDKAGQTHIKLSCEYGLTQINLGHLVNQERKPRGQGFELRTEHEGALRAQKGWLLTTDASDVRAEPQHDLTGLGAQMHNEPLQQHLKTIRPWADNRAKAAGQVGLEQASSLKKADQLQEQLIQHKAPLQAWSSPAGIALSARKNLIFASEQDQGFYAQGAVNLTSAAGLAITAKKGIRIHAESGGLKQVVSDGDYTVHVQDGNLEVLAKQELMLESKGGVVRLQTAGGANFVEVGPSGLRIKATQVIHQAGGKVDYTGGAVSGQPGATA